MIALIIALIVLIVSAIIVVILLLRRFSKAIMQQHETSFRQGWVACEEWMLESPAGAYELLQLQRSR